MRRLSAILVGALLALASSASVASAFPAAAPVPLGAAESFGVLGATTVTSAGVSTINGNLGVAPGTAMTGFPPGFVNGTMHSNDPLASSAHADLYTAYLNAEGRTRDAAYTVLDGLTLEPGVYGSGAALALAGTLKLDAKGDPNAVFIFQAGSTFITAAGSRVELAGGARACNVFWQVGSSVTLGANSFLEGSLLVHTNVTVGAGVTIVGRALAHGAAVTLDNDTVTAAHCPPGVLATTAPAISPFTTELTGLTRTVHATVGGWSVTDATGSNSGYNVTLAASVPTVGGSAAAAGTGAQLTLTPATPTAAAGNPASPGPVAQPPQTLSPTATTIARAAAGSGQGKWDFPADAGATQSLDVRIPGDASAGTFSSTLTFTTAPLASP